MDSGTLRIFARVLNVLLMMYFLGVEAVAGTASSLCLPLAGCPAGGGVRRRRPTLALVSDFFTPIPHAACESGKDGFGVSVLGVDRCGFDSHHPLQLISPAAMAVYGHRLCVA